jgi:hypothetical protein
LFSVPGARGTMGCEYQMTVPAPTVTPRSQSGSGVGGLGGSPCDGGGSDCGGGDCDGDDCDGDDCDGATEGSGAPGAGSCAAAVPALAKNIPPATATAIAPIDLSMISSFRTYDSMPYLPAATAAPLGRRLDRAGAPPPR